MFDRWNYQALHYDAHGIYASYGKTENVHISK